MIHRWYRIDQPWFLGYIFIMICTLLQHLRLSEHVTFCFWEFPHFCLGITHKSNIYLLSCIYDCCCCRKQYWTSEMFESFHNFESEQDVCLEHQSCSQYKLLRKTGDASSCSLQCAPAPDEPTLDLYLQSSITHVKMKCSWIIYGNHDIMMNILYICTLQHAMC